MDFKNAEPVDPLVETLLVERDEARLVAMFKELDIAADKLWWVRDFDYAAVMLQKAADRAPSATRRRALLGHAISRARTYASGATSGEEGWRGCSRQRDRGAAEQMSACTSAHALLPTAGDRTGVGKGGVGAARRAVMR